MPESQGDAELEFAAFRRAAAADLPDAFAALVRAVWAAGRPTARAASWARKATANLDEGSTAHQARTAVLLGLLAETADPAAAPGVRDAVREGLPNWLSLLTAHAARPAPDPALTLALLYLLAHFPEDAATLLDRTRHLPLTAEDRSRFERCLARRPATDPALGRVWPTPAGWTLTDEERATDRAWAAGLDDATAAAFWDKDTRSLLAYAGAKAYGALTVGLSPHEPSPPPAAPAADGAAPPPAAGPLGRHAGVIRCPACRGRLTEEAPGARCTACGARYAARRGYLDLTGAADGAADVIAVNAPMYLPRYESLLRPAFLRVHGLNWHDDVSVAAEHRYLAEHVAPAGGPVLDLAAGAGNWTRTLARTAGAGQVIALDLATAMLDRLTATLPGVLALRGSATELPFADASLGAVNCWNALQAMDDPGAAIREVGRCLRPGGTFTVLTFRPAPDPVYRHFQTVIEECLGVRSFDPDALSAALADAGMTIRHLADPGTFLLLTAVRAAPPRTA
ncbi:class I SAM-dependent methyltransferase [Streptomyces sp. RS10V-4]|uniref:methyltransferase domain-containing protein n=1 Tax=Streptomyces rhizoryzae TaxID=2932493 RepID=UPI0020063F64|nr:class I SAM-dependent methyltransferase [Streptomyces rhizoryzae]MCK7625847.1 class I SAM-dependent methyltransferase [Streptomyces rhizoryzae]